MYSSVLSIQSCLIIEPKTTLMIGKLRIFYDNMNKIHFTTGPAIMDPLGKIIPLYSISADKFREMIGATGYSLSYRNSTTC